MQVLIDNLDGKGTLDYTACIQFGKPSAIVRKLNKPSTSSLLLALEGSGLEQPAVHARVEIASATGALLFTGYVATYPESSGAGASEHGLVGMTRLVCLGDELLLDLELPTSQALLAGLSAEQDWASLGMLTGTTAFDVTLQASLTASSRVEIAPGTSWSDAAGMLAESTGSVYRAIGGAVQVSSIGNVAHTVTAGDPGLTFEAVSDTELKWLANDVTICGREEPTAYVTEIFQGDGVTTSFVFSEKPFSPVTAQKTAIVDLFQGTSLNPQVWVVSDAGSYLALTATGLTCLGGTGKEAETTVSSVREIELGGVLTIEATGVQVASGSLGTILGLYGGSVNVTNCFAAFNISTSVAGVSVGGLLNGAAAGTSMLLEAGHIYTLALRLYSPEMERTRQSYFYFGGGSWSSLGGEILASGGQITMTVQDATSGTPGTPVVLYTGSLLALPAACFLGLLDSGSLNCSIKSVNCTQAAPLAVSIAQAGISAAPQIIATEVEGGTCHIASTGTLTFYAGDVPATGALIYASYRAEAKAAARQSSSFSTAAATPQTAMWIGTVTTPVAWSSMDCERAAAAVLRMTSGLSSGLNGTYKCTSFEQAADIWPGDFLQIGPDASGAVIETPVQESQIVLTANVPEVLDYTVKFASEWAEGLAVKLSTTIPATVILPQAPTSLDEALLSLSNLAVTSVTGSTVGISTGVSAPVNGGFEVRRRDNTFGPGVDSDLVLRVVAQSITIPRAAAVEQYYIRMFDGATPPNYSLFSAAVFVNVPL
jgi:hypothetical protein